MITPTLAGREAMLAEAEMSVRAQTFPAAVHIMMKDEDHEGPAVARNAALRIVETEWVAFLDDDDLLYAHHLETLSKGSADVRASYCEFSGKELPKKYINRPYDRKVMRAHGIFGITVLARTEAIRDAGGFGEERYEDWALWNRMADNGCSFEVIPKVTWIYRLGHDNRTYA